MKKMLKALLLAIPALLLGACSSDEPALNDKDAPVVEKTELRYIRVNLVNPASGSDSPSRAIGDATGDYTNGTEAENKIRTIDFFFYDADKNFHSWVSMPISEPVDPTTTNITNPSVHGFYETNVPVNLVAGEKMPTYVLCVVNAVNPGYYDNKTMSEAQESIIRSIYSSVDESGNYFSMNNSVYYGRDEVTGLDNQLIMATPFDTNKLLTETDINKLEGDDLASVTIDIYVERYAAKVNFNISDNAVKPITTANGHTLEFTPKSWGMNAYETSMFALKSYRKTKGTTPDYDDYATMNGILFNGWNRPDHFRSFWARTPGYFDNDYPIVADDILDAAEYPYSVYYQSYETAKNTINTPQYLMETTLKGSRLTGADMPDQYLPLTSIPSVVLTGNYTLDGKAVTFYTYQKDSDGKPYVYAANEGDVDGLQTLYSRLLANQSVILKKSETGSGYTPVTDAAPGTFVIEHPVAAARRGLKIGGDAVTLQIKASNSGYYFYDSDARTYVLINDADKIAKANRLLYQTLGSAHAYVNGMAFFSAPVQHWGWQREDNVNKDKPVSEWDWTQMKTGDFGIVRNHVYTIQVSAINGIGTGIINDGDPLLPPTDKVSYAVHFRVNIQKWATLPTQIWEW